LPDGDDGVSHQTGLGGETAFGSRIGAQTSACYTQSGLPYPTELKRRYARMLAAFV
jgi:hypothetical protein